MENDEKGTQHPGRAEEWITGKKKKKTVATIIVIIVIALVVTYAFSIIISNNLSPRGILEESADRVNANDPEGVLGLTIISFDEDFESIWPTHDWVNITNIHYSDVQVFYGEEISQQHTDNIASNITEDEAEYGFTIEDHCYVEYSYVVTSSGHSIEGNGYLYQYSIDSKWYIAFQKY